MSVTRVLVVLNPSTYYGEDMREIDILENAVRKAVKAAKVQVSFMITDNISIAAVGDKVDYIAFCHYSTRTMRDALDKGMKVLDYNPTTFTFEEVED